MKHIAVFASGTGSNAEKIIQHFASSTTAEVSLLVSNKRDSGVKSLAEKHSIPFLFISGEELKNDEFLLPKLKEHKIDFIVLAGFLLLIPSYLVRVFDRRMINVHPSLLPRFGGKGYFGKHVHEAVLRANEKESGISIHYVSEEFDEGKIIFQAKCEVEKEDIVATLSAKIQKLEHSHLPLIVEKLVHEL